MKFIAYQTDNEFNLSNKFEFENINLLLTYMNKHISEEPEVSFIVLTFNDEKELITMATYKRENVLKVFQKNKD